MSFFAHKPDLNKPQKPCLDQSQASAFDVVWLTFKVFLPRIQFWILLNLWNVIFSLGLVTAPAAKAALYHTVALGLRDPGDSEVNVFAEMKVGFKCFFWKALLISVIRWFVLIVIAFSIYFWVGREAWTLRVVSIISFYALLLWWMSSGYLYPVLVDNPNLAAWQVLKQGLLLAFKNPFLSLLFTVVDTLLLICGVVFLLGPITIIIPALRSILLLQGYWYLTGRVIPGFMDIHEYTNKYYDIK